MAAAGAPGGDALRGAAHRLRPLPPRRRPRPGLRRAPSPPPAPAGVEAIAHALPDRPRRGLARRGAAGRGLGSSTSARATPAARASRPRGRCRRRRRRGRRPARSAPAACRCPADQLDRGQRGRHRPGLGRHPVGEDQPLVRHDVEVHRLVLDRGPGPEAEARDTRARRRGSRRCTRRPPSPRPRRTSGAWPRSRRRRGRPGPATRHRRARAGRCCARRGGLGGRGHVSSFPSSSR